MGRLPCCDKVGVKKGPWTPEEDIILVSYVQQHGAANWRSVPTNTGLKRCSKSCRLRWTNYLRPGIKRGVFTCDEEKIIIQLQSLFGNKWAAISSYLPDRTDNDIKNYWNTHLKKKLLKTDQNSPSNAKPTNGCSYSHSISRGQWEIKLQTDINMAKQALSDALTSSPHIQTHTYISSTENIARLLKNWDQSTNSDKIRPFKSNSSSTQYSLTNELSESMSNDKNRALKFNSSSTQCLFTCEVSESGTRKLGVDLSEAAFKSKSLSTQHSFTCAVGESGAGKLGVDLSEAFESLFGFESFDSNSEFSQSNMSCESKPELSGVQMSMLENWVIDQQGVVEEKPDLSSFSFYENADLF